VLIYANVVGRISDIVGCGIAHQTTAGESQKWIYYTSKWWAIAQPN